MDVGVRELKKHLSEYLARVARGETVRVTDRGEPKALLCPLPGRAQLDEGVEQGWIQAGSDEVPKPAARQRSQRRIAEVLLEDRER